MSKQIYEVKLDSFVLNGEVCQNIEVKWDKPECISVVCDDDENHIYRITIPEGCEETCLYGVVYCLDESCGECPDFKRIVVCPCEDDSDCGECEECDENGMCVNICPDDTFCNNDICVECDSEHPCECNEICVAGKCQCPADLPYMDSKGCCHKCRDNDDCPNCTYCTPDGCVPIDCGDGVCDPLTGVCVECNNSGDCTGINECCMPDHTCDCCPGYKRNLVTGICEPDDGCVVDEDCEVCEICVGDICVPLECPDGYTCIDGECIKMCDCDEIYCSSTEACVDPSTGICYCSECKGDCDEDNECGPGCICDNFNCVPSPCKGQCVNGTDCGEGCGCLDGWCVPCSKHSCEAGGDCDKVLGCGCTDFGCVDIGGCVGFCTTHYDCGDGCTCWEGYCVPCKDFSCITTECANQPGCECDGNSNCIGDGSGGDDCKDILSVDKIDETCDLKGELKVKEDCTCPKMTFNTLFKKIKSVGTGYYLLDLDVELRKGLAKSLQQAFLLPKVGDTTKVEIAENEAPESGTVSVVVLPYFNTYDSTGKLTGVNEEGIPKEYSVSFGNVNITDTVSFKDIKIPHIGSFYDGNETTIISKVEVKVFQKTTLTFPNKCDYNKGSKNISKFTITLNNKSSFEKAGNDKVEALKFEDYLVITSESKRNALFTWYRSDNNSYSDSDVLRKVYKTSSNKDYIDILYGPKTPPKGKQDLDSPEGGLKSGKFYMLKTDCTCAEPVDLGKVVFCNPKELRYEVLECSTKVKLLQPFVPCDVNKDLTRFGINDSVSQVKYDLYLNGIKVKTFVDNKSVDGMVQEGTTKSMFDTYDLNGDVIEKIELKINHDDKDECTLTYDLPKVQKREVKYTVNCSVEGDRYVVTIPRVNQVVSIDSVTVISGNGNIRTLGNDILVNIKKGVPTLVEVLFIDNCKQTLSFNENCCDDMSVDLTQIDESMNCVQEASLKVQITGGSAPFDITFVAPSKKEFNTGASTILEIDSNDFESGIWTVNVKDAVGCASSDTLNLSSTSYEFHHPDSVLICDGENTEIQLRGSTGAKVYVSGISGISNPVAINSKLLVDSSVNEVIYTGIDYNGCHYLINEKTIVQVDEKPFAILGKYGIEVNCDDDFYNLTVTGTPNATVYYTINNSSEYNLILDSNGEGVIYLEPSENVVDFTVKIIKVKLNNCENNENSSVQVHFTWTPELIIDNSSYQCTNDLSKYSVELEADYPIVQSNKGDVTKISGNTWKVSNITKGQSATITGINGTCTRSTSTAAYQCTCNEAMVDKPVSTGDQTYCEDNDSIPMIGVTVTNPTYTVEWYDKYNNYLGTGLFYQPTESDIYGSATTFYARAIDTNGCQSENEVVMVYTNYPIHNVSIAEPYSTNHCENTELVLAAYVDNSGNLATPPFQYEWTVVGAQVLQDNGANIVLLLPSAGNNVQVDLKVISDEGCYKYAEQLLITDIKTKILADIEFINNIENNTAYGWRGTVFNGDEVNVVSLTEAWGKVNNGLNNENNRLNIVGKEPTSNIFSFAGSYVVGSDIPKSIGFAVDNYGILQMKINDGEWITLFDFKETTASSPNFGGERYRELYHELWWVNDLPVVPQTGDTLCFRLINGYSPQGPIAFGVELYKEFTNVLDGYTSRAEVDLKVITTTDIFGGYKTCPDGSEPIIEACTGYCQCNNNA